MRNMMPVKVIAFIFCTLLLFPCTAWSVEEDGEKPNEKRIYKVIEFESTFMNRKKEDLLKALGEPDLKSEHRGHEVWQYHRIIKEQGKLWDQNILFNFGRVNQMWGTPTGRH